MRYGQWQTRLNTWALRVFGTDHLHDPVVRGKRLLEEAAEFAQSVGVPDGAAREILDHVYSRPPGEPFQELGGVALTFLASCTSLGLEAEYVTHMELERVESKPDSHFQKRNAEKKALFG
jgi:hypothetical protein